MLWKSQLRCQDPRTQVYLGSPSVLRLPDGALLAVHDFFGKFVKNAAGENGLMAVYRSEDNGGSWRQITFIDGAFWGNMFIDGGAVYHFGSSQEYGNIVIRRSTDGGYTWSEPTDSHSGLIRVGGPGWEAPNYETSGCIEVIRGRICAPCAEMTGSGGRWSPERYEMFVLSAPAGCDLLKAENWRESNHLRFRREKVPDPSLAGERSGWLEGSPVEDPSGNPVLLARVHLERPDYAAKMELSADLSELSFCYETGLVGFVGGHSKFEVRRDPRSGWYFALTNEYTGGTGHPVLAARNKLVLAVSEDLTRWRKAATLLEDDSGLSPEESRQLTGFQYVDWRFDGEDIIYLCRCSYRGAANFHNSNRITYHVIPEFRRLIRN